MFCFYLLLLQCLHVWYFRGQESAGIVTSSGGKFSSAKNMGLVNHVFQEAQLKQLKGSLGIGLFSYTVHFLLIFTTCCSVIDDTDTRYRCNALMKNFFYISIHFLHI